jgi:hypothetical protein
MQHAPNAHSGEFAYSIGYLGETSDNVFREPSNPNDDVAHSAIVSIGYQESNSELLARVRAQAQYRDYKYDSFEDETIYYVDAAAIWSILPRALTWSVFDRADQLTEDVSLADTPDNRVNVNAFSTGPDVYIRFGNVNTLAVGARYGNVIYDENLNTENNDNNRYGAHTSWTYQASLETAFSLNYLHERVEYIDAVLNDNYRRQDAFVRAAWNRPLSQFVVDAGGTIINKEQGLDESGPSVRLTWNQMLNTDSIFTVLLGREFLDPGMALLATITDPSQITELSLPTPTIPSDGLAEIYYTNRAEITFRYDSGIMALDARAFYRDFEYLPTLPPTPPDLSDDRDENGFLVDLAYNPAGTFVPAIFYSRTNTSYWDFFRDDQLSEAGARLLYRSTRQLSTSLEYRRSVQTSTDPSQEFTENYIILALIYSSNAELAQVNPQRR